jgi:hypothetical protein
VPNCVHIKNLSTLSRFFCNAMQVLFEISAL